MELYEIEPGIMFIINERSGQYLGKFFIKLHPDQPYFNKPIFGYLKVLDVRTGGTIDIKADVKVTIMRSI